MGRETLGLLVVFEYQETCAGAVVRRERGQMGSFVIEEGMTLRFNTYRCKGHFADFLGFETVVMELVLEMFFLGHVFEAHW